MHQLTNIMIKIAITALTCMVLFLYGCAHAPSKASLFERLGGLPVLTVVVSETIDQVSNNPKTKRSFDGIKLIKLKESVVAQLCNLTGGGCVYDGETMKKSHIDSHITTAEFEVFVQTFREALDRHVGTREKNELLKILAPMKRDIVDNNPTKPS